MFILLYHMMYIKQHQNQIFQRASSEGVLRREHSTPIEFFSYFLAKNRVLCSNFLLLEHLFSFVELSRQSSSIRCVRICSFSYYLYSNCDNLPLAFATVYYLFTSTSPVNSFFIVSFYH